MSDDHFTHLGQRKYWGGEMPFGVRRGDRRNHTYVIGKTGTGKSTLLRNLILDDIESGQGVALIDPHGDLARDVLQHIPPWRTDDVVYFNPADLNFPIGLNLLERVSPHNRHRVASAVIESFKSLWRESWGPRLEYILYASVAALLDTESSTILGIPRMFTDPRYRRWVVDQCNDCVVRSFWVNEFERYDKRFLLEAIAPIQNKVGRLLMSAPIRNVLGQVRRKFDPRFMIDNRRILIADLSKGTLGEDKANFLGSLLVCSFELAAMSRADVPAGKRPDFNLIIDEFSNFTTDSFTSILSEARKYGLALVLAGQYTSQMSDVVRNAVFGNVGTHIAFCVGEQDAKVLAGEFGNTYAPATFSSLDNFEVIAKMPFAGRYGEPFRATTDPPTDTGRTRRIDVIQRSRERYASRCDVVEEKIQRFMERMF
jgi:hypothetical protein